MDTETLQQIIALAPNVGVTTLLLAFTLYGIRQHNQWVERYVKTLEDRIKHLEVLNDLRDKPTP